MANGDSVQKRLNKVRPPRVQMTYEVVLGVGLVLLVVPFVLGVIGDYGGNSEKEQKRLKDRRFVNVDNDNFDEVLAGVEPVAQFQAPNTLTGDGSLRVELRFRKMEDFRPESVVRQVEPLARLLEARSKLADLRNKLAGNDKLEDILTDVLQNTDQLSKLKPSQGE
jgi:type VI secretion system protein ImpB